MRRADSAQLDNGNTKTIQDSRLAKHFYFWTIGVLPMFWLLQQHNAPSISKKFAWCIISPVSHSPRCPLDISASGSESYVYYGFRAPP